MKFKNFLGFFVLLIVFSGFFFFANPFNIQGLESFGDCRIIKEGNVCEKYTDCLFDGERGLSCVKGYELVDFRDNSSFEEIVIEEGGAVFE